MKRTVLLAPLVLLAAACSTAAAHHSASVTPTPDAHPVAAATASQSCADQVHAWAHDQGTAQLDQLSSDTTTLGKDALKAVVALTHGGSSTSQVATWQAAATALETDAQTAASNPPPSCGDAADYGTAMQDYTTSARDYESAASDISAGSYGSAAPLVTAGASAMRNGTTAIARVTATFNSLGTTSPAPSAFPATAADTTVCRGFLRVGQTKSSADRFMAWITFGVGRPVSNRASKKLITAVATWYDDSYMNWGDASSAAGDRSRLEADCQSLTSSG